VPPQEVRRGQKKVYCCEEHQKADWNRRHPRVGQKSIDFDPPAHPQPRRTSAAKQRLDEERAKEAVYRWALLARLQEGRPLRRSEVKAFGGDRFSARIDELRAEGHHIIGPRRAPRRGITRTTTRIDGEDVYLLLKPEVPNHGHSTTHEANQREVEDKHAAPAGGGRDDPHCGDPSLDH
jgi:hypothetical protein